MLGYRFSHQLKTQALELTDKRFWIFEAFAILSTVLTLGLMELFYKFRLDSDVIPTCIIMLTTYLIGHAVAWKSNKSCAWLKLGLTTYLFSAVALAVIFAIISVIDWLAATEVSDDISADVHVGFSALDLTLVIILIWSIVSFIPAMVTAFVASLCFRAKTTVATGIELRSISLESIGVDGIAYTKSEALRIAEEYYNSNIPILGGDVYLFNNGNIKPTYDNWYCNRNNSETSYEYLVRSYQVACDYIKKYPDNANIFFSIVKGHIDE